MNIYQHFRKEEREFIDQVLDWKDHVENTYAPKLTDFLDPREQQIVKMIVGKQSDVRCDFFGGYDGSERRRALFYPDYYEVKQEDFQVQLFEVEYAKKFLTIAHKQVLGSLMSLGLKRGKYGDILIKDERVQFFTVKEIKDYVGLNLNSIGRATISVKELPLENSIQTDETWEEASTTASSLRLDTLLSAVFNISRQKSQLFIQQGHVKVNWTTVENTAFECGEADVLSLRGHGRAKISSIEGKTKKDKWRIVYGRHK
ncbi:RNA-binding protein [Bacillus sp. 31A1R]|uniref:RNA-binding protein n=1 Tax=Robertmurraya mangrovi TaxID=3098077 RepID=A0ABU5IU83_9BACI|nr:RNA-binding protein [Bacillus sp. 31A1R]MDZ5470718.1 RNA-binding protein [Bacillus sp. 31A1R]